MIVFLTLFLKGTSVTECTHPCGSCVLLAWAVFVTATDVVSAHCIVLYYRTLNCISFCLFLPVSLFAATCWVFWSNFSRIVTLEQTVKVNCVLDHSLGGACTSLHRVRRLPPGWRCVSVTCDRRESPLNSPCEWYGEINLQLGGGLSGHEGRPLPQASFILWSLSFFSFHWLLSYFTLAYVTLCCCACH